ncbi:hypothetical protein D3C80_860090 [compost metagenome]
MDLHVRLERDTQEARATPAVWQKLGGAQVHDKMLECEHFPRLSFRNTAGIHQAIRIISRLASEQCGKVMERNGQDPER